MRDGAKVLKALLAAQNSTQAQQLTDVQKQAATICRSLSEYRSKSSSGIQSEFQEFCRCLSNSACDNVQTRQRRIEGSVNEESVLFGQILQTLESALAKQVCFA